MFYSLRRHRSTLVFTRIDTNYCLPSSSACCRRIHQAQPSHKLLRIRSPLWWRGTLGLWWCHRLRTYLTNQDPAGALALALPTTWGSRTCWCLQTETRVVPQRYYCNWCCCSLPGHHMQLLVSWQAQSTDLCGGSPFLCDVSELKKRKSTENDFSCTLVENARINV